MIFRQQASIIQPTMTPQRFSAPIGSGLVLDAAMDGACQVELGGARVAGQAAVLPQGAPPQAVNSAAKPFYR